MDVIHTISGLAAVSGGPSRSVTALCNYLAEIAGIEVALLTQRTDESVIEPESQKVHFHTVPVYGKMQAKVALRFRKFLKNFLALEPFTVLHAHGVWDATTYWSAVLARRYGTTLVLHPRGMLDPWCLSYKASKKKLAMALYARRMLESVDLFVATAHQELESIRALGLRQPVAVLPNGVDQLERACAEENQQAGKRALFLSRVHPVKGIVQLIHAWAQVAPKGWILTVAGPNENGYWKEVRREIDALGLKEQVTYVGEVYGDAKAQLFFEADLFILPSFSENFGIVVAEALAHGLPVIATTGTPWQMLPERGCGWWTQPSVEGLADALRDATRRTPAELRQMGERGRTLAREFDWNHIARQMVDVYRWLRGSGEKPDCVVLD